MDNLDLSDKEAVMYLIKIAHEIQHALKTQQGTIPLVLEAELDDALMAIGLGPREFVDET